MNPFHLAIAVHDLEASRNFYVDLLGVKIGRETNTWMDFDFFGHQLSVHLKPEETNIAMTNKVDGKSVPVRHFGVILEWKKWHNLAEHLKYKKLDFLIEPYTRFKGEIGEQATMFFFDPSGNALEFKSFKSPSQIFAK